MMVSYFNSCVPSVMSQYLRPYTPILNKPVSYPDLFESSSKWTDQAKDIDQTGIHPVLMTDFTIKHLLKDKSMQTGFKDCMRTEKLVPTIVKHLFAESLACDKKNSEMSKTITKMENSYLKCTGESHSDSQPMNSIDRALETPIVVAQPEQVEQTINKSSRKMLDVFESVDIGRLHNCKDRTLTQPSKCYEDSSHGNIDKTMVLKMEVTLFQSSNLAQVLVQHSKSDGKTNYHQTTCAFSCNGGESSVASRVCDKSSKLSEKELTNVNAVTESQSKSKDRTSVLFDRKKCSKKGRPSSKKQKKRQREKQKQTVKTSTESHNEQYVEQSQNERTSSVHVGSSTSIELNFGIFAASIFSLGSDDDISDASDDWDTNTYHDDWLDDSAFEHLSSNLSSVRFKADAFPHIVTVEPQHDKAERVKKVHFPKDSDMVTVFHLEPEDRRNYEWRIQMADQERFRRLVEACGHIISPVLCPNHRMKVFQRNQYLNEA